MALRGKTVAALMPAYNEERQLPGVLVTIPDFVDHVVVVDDASTDRTAEIVREASRRDPRVVLLRHEENRGVGAAIATAYKWALRNDVDCAVAMDADGQMDPGEMIKLVGPVVDGLTDYTKGNRLISPAQWRHIPRVRLIGNAVLSLLTKIASGYWSVADSQSGYTAMSRYGMQSVEWDALYKGYGRPNDTLVRLNVANCRVADVPIRAVYGVGERSMLKVPKAIFTISFMLFRRFWWRLFHKYVLRDFHPLVFFYMLGIFSFVVDVALIVRLVMHRIGDGRFPATTTLAVAFFTITMLNSTFFAFWMDMQVNEPLAVRLPEYYAPRSELTPVEPSRAATETAAVPRPPAAPSEKASSSLPGPSG